MGNPTTPNTGIEYSEDPQRIDIDAVWKFLSTESADIYWGTWRTRQDFVDCITGSWRVVGAYDPATGATVGFGRVVSDGVGFAYLADVWVHPECRGRGAGKGLVKALIYGVDGDSISSAFRWVLYTRDAHGLYEQFGFRQIDADRALERPLARG